MPEAQDCRNPKYRMASKQIIEAKLDLNPCQQKAWELFSDFQHRYILLYGGGGSGKSDVTAQMMWSRWLNVPGSRQAVFRATSTACRQTMFDKTFKQVAERRWPGLITNPKACIVNESEMTFENPTNGALLKFGGLQDSNLDRILGDEVLGVLLNEGTELDFAHFNVVNSRLRQKGFVEINGQRFRVKNKLVIDCNPTDHLSFLYPLFMKGVSPDDGLPVADPEDYAALKMLPRSNEANLDEDYFKAQRAGGADHVRRFVEGDWKLEVDGALFKSRDFRYVTSAQVPDLVRIIVAVDPAVSEGSDETGIIVAGIDAEGHGYILSDLSAKGSISVWADKIVEAARDWKADAIIVERNNGGVLVEETLRKCAPNQKIETVWASRGKVVRAEPVAHLFERHLVNFVGDATVFKDLQSQLVQFTQSYNRARHGSPDRLDAMVWALFALMIEQEDKPATFTAGGMSGFV